MDRAPEIPGLTDLVLIGEGGNGVVYRAMQSQLRRVVAVKLLSARLDGTAAERFAREGEALGLVSGHPNIVPVYSADTTSSGAPYLVMQLCEGGSLADRVERRGPMPWQQVVDMGIRIAGALQTAHDAGLLHRDIKPGNILFDSYGAPMLADFGQAQHADVHLTRTGDVVATPGFASPEVLTGSKATVRSDVYSLATTMVAAILGYSPFSRDSDENVAATLLRVLQEAPPDLRQHGVPDPITRVLERAMSKQPGHRPMTAAEFGRDLMRAQEEVGVPVTQMIVPPKADVTTPFVPATAPQTGHTPTAPFGSQPPRTAQLGSQPPHTAPYDSGSLPTNSPGKRRIVVLGVVLVVLIAAVVWGATMLLNGRDAKQVSAASELLIGGESFGDGTWQTTDQDGPVEAVLGPFLDTGEGKPEFQPSAMSECLGLEFDDYQDAKSSATYYDAAKDDPQAETVSDYLMGDSLSVVLNDAATAKAYVEAFSGPTFDTCLDSLQGIGQSVAQEWAAYSATAKISVPSFDPDPPDSVTYRARTIAVPLQRASDGDEGADDEPASDRYLTIIAMAAGTSLDIVVFQSSAAELAESTFQATYDAFLEVATE